MSVAPCSWIISRTRLVSNFGSSSTVPPERIVALRMPDKPSEWNSGMTAMTLLDGFIAKASTWAPAFMNSWKWVSWTPLGLPVVPEVYSRMAVSPG